MSVYIKGMEMPEEHEVICVFPNGIVQKRIIKWSSLYDVLNQSNAIPVPPHGRLIDESALLKGCGYIIADGMACIPVKYIANSPTIIPASEEGET